MKINPALLTAALFVAIIATDGRKDQNFRGDDRPDRGDTEDDRQGGRGRFRMVPKYLDFCRAKEMTYMDDEDTKVEFEDEVTPEDIDADEADEDEVKDKMKKAKKVVKNLAFFCAADIRECGFVESPEPTCPELFLENCESCFANVMINSTCLCECQETTPALAACELKRVGGGGGDHDDENDDDKDDEDNDTEGEVEGDGRRRMLHSKEERKFIKMELSKVLKDVKECFAANLANLSETCSSALVYLHRGAPSDEEPTEETLTVLSDSSSALADAATGNNGGGSDSASAGAIGGAVAGVCAVALIVAGVAMKKKRDQLQREQQEQGKVVTAQVVDL